MNSNANSTSSNDVNRIDPDVSLGELINANPALATVFERLQIDFCCGGNRKLSEALVGQDITVEAIETALASTQYPAMEHVDWSHRSVGELLDHILETHHAYLKIEFPKLSTLMEKVSRVHGERHPHLLELRATVETLIAELENHLMKEENVLFPMARALENGQADAENHCGGVANPVRVMEMEHDDAGVALRRMRALTHDYAVPEDACGSYRRLYERLAALEADLHLHIHKENNLLHPRLLRLSQARRDA